MKAPSSIQAVVVDEEDRRVPQARVALWRLSEDAREFGDLFARAETNDAGSVVFQELPTGQYLLAATWASGTRFRRAVRSLELHGEEAHSLRLRFEDEACLSGVVVDAAGRPLRDVEVQVIPSSDWSSQGEEELAAYATFLRLGTELLPTSSVRTGPDGRFMVRHPLPVPLDVSCHRWGYEQVTVSSASWDDPEEYLEMEEPPDGSGRLPYLRVPAGASDCRLVLAYQGSVSGRLVGPDGEPITSFFIDGARHRHPEGAFKRTSGMRGPEGHVPELTIQAPGFVGIRRAVAKWGEDVDLGTVVLEAGRPVRVQVVDAGSSLPLGFASLSLRDVLRDQTLEKTELGLGQRDSLKTGPEGTCLLPTVPGQPVDVTVTHEGYRTACARLDPEALEVTIPLRSGAVLQGRVRAGGEPLHSGRVELSSRGGSSTTLWVRDGWYSGPILPPGSYLATASYGLAPRSGPIFLPRRVEVPEEGTVSLDFDDVCGNTTLEVHVFEGLSELDLVVGRVSLPENIEQYVRITELAHPADPPRPLTLEERRERKEKGDRPRRDYRFRRVPAGRYTLLGLYGWTWRERTWLFFRQEVEIPAEGTVMLELLPPPGLISR